MSRRLFVGKAWTAFDYAWTAHSYLADAKDLLEKRGQTKDAEEIGKLAALLVDFADRIEEETEAEHALDVSCVVNAGAN